jgi:hypothetical protein
METSDAHVDGTAEQPQRSHSRDFVFSLSSARFLAPIADRIVDAIRLTSPDSVVVR